MRPVPSVMIREDGEDPFEMPLIQNQQPIEALGTSGAHEPFRDTVRLWSTKRRANDLHPRAAEDLIETAGELLSSVANQEADRFLALRQGPCYLSGLLRHPQRGRIRRASGKKM